MSNLVLVNKESVATINNKNRDYNYFFTLDWPLSEKPNVHNNLFHLSTQFININEYIVPTIEIDDKLVINGIVSFRGHGQSYLGVYFAITHKTTIYGDIMISMSVLDKKKEI